MTTIIKIFTCVILTCIYTATAAGRSSDTLSIFFGLNDAHVVPVQQARLNNYFNHRNTDSTWLIINGYADYTGNDAYNSTLSTQRADNVKAQLLKAGIKETAIKTCIGHGAIKSGKQQEGGVAHDRRVDIIPVSYEIFNSYETATDVTASEPYSFPFDKLEKGETFVLEGLYFLPNRHTFTPESEPLLEQLYTEMKNHPNLKIKLEGHICCIPIERDQAGIIQKRDAVDFDVKKIVMETRGTCVRPVYYSNALSINRAKMIYDYLVKRGIDRARLSFCGYGNAKPLKEDPHYEKNKRVEVRVIEQ